MKWIIEDWAGNRLWGDNEFDSFEDGWAHVRANSAEDNWQDIYVVEKSEAG
jgi:hypothetical protein